MVIIFVLVFLHSSCAEVSMHCGPLFLGRYPCMSLSICQHCTVSSTASFVLLPCCSLLYCPSRASFNFLSGLVALCYQFGYLFCPVWFVLMFVTPRDGLLGSVFDGITDCAVVLVRVFPNAGFAGVYLIFRGT